MCLGPNYLNMKSKQFHDLINKANVPVVVDFWAPWCGPCKITKPILEKIAEEFKGKVEFLQVNADESQELLGEYGVRGIPTLIAFRGGTEVTRMIGAKPANQFHALFKSLADGTPMKRPGVSWGSVLLRLVAGGVFLYLGWQGNDMIYYALGGVVLLSLGMSLYAGRK